MRSPLRTRMSTPTSSKLLESAASVEVRRLRVRQELKRTREYHGRKFQSDRKVARRCNRFVLVVASALLPARANHPIGRIRLILSDKLSRKRGRVRSFVDRNKTCT